MKLKLQKKIGPMVRSARINLRSTCANLHSACSLQLIRKRKTFFFGFCKEIPRYRARESIMCENDSLSQHHYFLHDKSPSNGESLQIHKRRYYHNEQFFETALYCKTYRFLYWERMGIFVNVAIYEILRTDFTYQFSLYVRLLHLNIMYIIYSFLNLINPFFIFIRRHIALRLRQLR